MSGKPPADGGKGRGRGGPARAYSWPPFELDNGAARRHSFYAEKLQAAEREEIAELAEHLRDLVLIYSPAFEPSIQLLASRLWRLRVGYRYIEEHGFEDLPGSLLGALATLENTISRDFEALGLSPRSAARLGVDLKRLEAAGAEGEVDLSVLDEDERRELRRLLSKVSRDD